MPSINKIQEESGYSKLNNPFYRLGIVALKAVIFLSMASSLTAGSEACIRRGIVECTIFGDCDNSPPRG